MVSCGTFGDLARSIVAGSDRSIIGDATIIASVSTACIYIIFCAGTDSIQMITRSTANGRANGISVRVLATDRILRSRRFAIHVINLICGTTGF